MGPLALLSEQPDRSEVAVLTNLCMDTSDLQKECVSSACLGSRSDMWPPEAAARPGGNSRPVLGQLLATGDPIRAWNLWSVLVQRDKLSKFTN